VSKVQDTFSQALAPEKRIMLGHFQDAVWTLEKTNRPPTRTGHSIGGDRRTYPCSTRTAMPHAEPPSDSFEQLCVCLRRK
jgi:hypothetical protein